MNKKSLYTILVVIAIACFSKAAMGASVAPVEVQLTPEQCVAAYGRTAYLIALERDKGTPLKLFLQKQQEKIDQMVKDGNTPDPAVTAIIMEMTRDIYLLSKKTPDDILNIYAQECFSKHGKIRLKGKAL